MSFTLTAPGGHVVMEVEGGVVKVHADRATLLSVLRAASREDRVRAVYHLMTELLHDCLETGGPHGVAVEEISELLAGMSAAHLAVDGLEPEVFFARIRRTMAEIGDPFRVEEEEEPRD